jgi:hypothetical protein
MSQETEQTMTQLLTYLLENASYYFFEVYNIKSRMNVEGIFQNCTLN